MKKKLIICVVILILAIVLIYTNIYFRNNNTNKENEKLKIVTSFYPIYVSTLNVVDNMDNVEVINLTQTVGGCLHDYQLLPQDMVELETADVLIVNGGGMEEFLDKVINSYPDLKIIYASDEIEFIEEKHHQADEHEEHQYVNSHVWLSIDNNIKQVENITKGLSTIDKVNSEKYKNNANKYILELNNLKEESKKQLAEIKNKNIITSNETFSYFMNDMDINIAMNLEDEIGVNPNTGDIARTIENMSKLNIDAIISDSQEENNFAKTISNETGIKVYELNPVVKGENNKDEYIKIMKDNINILKNI